MRLHSARVARLLFLTICLVFGTIGCATTGPQIHVNGLPAPDHIVYGGEGTPINYILTLTRHFNEKEGSEEVSRLEYVPMYEPLVLKDDTKSLVFTARLLNRNKVGYTMWDVVEVLYEDDKYPVKTIYQTYEGSLSVQEFAKSLPIKNVETATFSTEIKDTDGNTILTLGPVEYRKSKGGVYSHFE